MTSAVLDSDSELFKQATSVPTRWEQEALASIAAAAVTELAAHTQETPAAVLRRLQQALTAAR